MMNHERCERKKIRNMGIDIYSSTILQLNTGPIFHYMRGRGQGRLTRTKELRLVESYDSKKRDPTVLAPYFIKSSLSFRTQERSMWPFQIRDRIIYICHVVVIQYDI
jgi:hypothetical protein